MKSLELLQSINLKHFQVKGDAAVYYVEKYKHSETQFFLWKSDDINSNEFQLTGNLFVGGYRKDKDEITFSSGKILNVFVDVRVDLSGLKLMEDVNHG